MFNIKKICKLFTTMTFAMVLLFVVKTNAYGASYTVLQGDSLFKIGQLFNMTTSTIKTTNNISSDIIYPGQKLNVTAKIYSVKAGDTLYLISKTNSVTLASLRTANNKWDDILYPGQTLVLPYSYTSIPQASSGQAVVSYTQSELDLLARLITAEAENQSYTAKVAVGAVVINRVQSGQFASSISSVINQRINGYYQFTPVLNGYINYPASADAKKAAQAALYGSDPSYGALFYFDDSTTNTWLWSKPITARYGNMVFAK